MKGPTMIDPVEVWHSEHQYFRRLLDLLERQIDVFHAGEAPNYPLMLDIIYYLRHFTDQSHHPREDVAFARLAERAPEMQLQLARLAQEHRVIIHIGRNLEQSLERAAADVFVPRTDIEALAATYLSPDGSRLGSRAPCGAGDAGSTARQHPRGALSRTEKADRARSVVPALGMRENPLHAYRSHYRRGTRPRLRTRAPVRR
jgi:hypothetical protein